MRVACALAIALAVVCALHGTARAQTRTELAIDEALPRECSATFAGELARKTQNVSVVASSTDVVRVRIERDAASASGFSGTVSLEASERVPSIDRTIRGTTCDDVLRGLALVAAVTLEGSPAPAPSPSAPAPASAPASPPSPPAEPPPATPAPRALSIAFSAGANVSSLVPNPPVGLAVGAELADSRPSRAPAVRVRFGGTFPADASSTSGSVALSWLVGSIEGCPVGLPFGTIARVRPCVGVDLGTLSARGSGAALAETGSATRFWPAVSAQLRADVDLFGPVGAAVYGGAIAPLARDRIVFRGPAALESVYRAPAVAAAAGVEAIVRFP